MARSRSVTHIRIIALSWIYFYFIAALAGGAVRGVERNGYNGSTDGAPPYNNSSGDYNNSMEFLVPQNEVRAEVGDPSLEWDLTVENYALWWADQRRGDCQLVHSDGPYGENIFWGGGDGWTPLDAVKAWADEKQYYDYETNGCAGGEMCGHYTQIVWKNSARLGCARVVCDNGDVFMTCNYDPPGNYIGERPY